MEIEKLTIGEAREIARLFANTSSQPQNGSHPMLGKHCVVRTYSAGVHIGTPTQINGTEVLLKNSRRLYSWKGAFTLSEVATDGIESKNSRMALELDQMFLTQAIEFIPTTEKAQKTFNATNEK